VDNVARAIFEAMHPVIPTLPVADQVEDPRVMLRDGTVAGIRPSTLADLPRVRDFFGSLSPESRYHRFCSAGEVPDSVLEGLCDSGDPGRQLTLVAERSVGDSLRIIAVASYGAVKPDAAEVSFAVAETFQGKGVATALLERLAGVAVTAGFRRFLANTLEDNVHMLAVFRDSGFQIRSRSAEGSIDVQLSLEPSKAGATAEDERSRLATTASLRPLLAPGAIAVIGASRNASSIGRRVFDALRTAGFAGPVYPVNRGATAIADVAAYRSARDLPAGVDLAVVAVPASAVPSVVDDCAAAGVRSLVVITAGFAEAGADGAAVQASLTRKVRGYGMRMVGPNCMGVLNASPAVRMNASFSPIFPRAGHIGLLSQSGALGLAILALAAERRLGLSTFVSVGNKADVSGNDLLEYWDGDPETRVILFYLESFGNPRRFARLARRIGHRKPIIVIKSGRTRAGSRAASGHTAALAANDVGVDALLRQSGIIRADTLDEMLDIAACLDAQPLPRGRRVGIVTNAGGPGILAADACEAAGLKLAEFSSATLKRLEAALPAMAVRSNPIDMIASARATHYRDTIRIALGAEEVDALIVIFTPVDPRSADAIFDAIREGVAGGRAAGGQGKPVLACVMAEPGRPLPLDVNDEWLPAFVFPENAARALGKVTAYAEWRSRKPALFWGFDDLRPEEARAVCRQAAERGGEGWLTDDEVRQVLAAFNLPLAAGGIARTADEAVSLADRIGFPVAAKLSSPAVQHKTDIGGVRLDLGDEPAVRRAFADLQAASAGAGKNGRDSAVLVQQMVKGGVETMIGITRDPVFGPLVGFGLGGIHVEILADVCFRIAPLTDRDVEELLHEIRGFKLLEGYRGHPAADLTALRELLLRVSGLADAIPEIAELDLNPVMALSPGQGCRVVDARIRVRRPG
jgi:acetate---CoA ligase (ADP-forming)